MFFFRVSFFNDYKTAELRAISHTITRAKLPLDWAKGVRLEGYRALPGGGTRTKITELFADERCRQAILDFLATDVGRTAGRPTGGRRRRSSG